MKKGYYPFFSDPMFQAQFVRAMGHACAGGADMGECLAVASQITDGDRESWYHVWWEKAKELEGMAQASAQSQINDNARGQFLRASNYYRTAAIIIEDDPEDPRILTAWQRQADTFRQATRYFHHPVHRIEIPFEGLRMPGYLYLHSDSLRPLIIMLGGGDGTLEEVYFTVAEAIKRGFHCLTFDGPGQGEVLRVHQIPFRPDWENIVTAAVDYALEIPQVDKDRLVLMGRSLGGYLATRAVSCEKRIAACVVDPGIYDSYEIFLKGLPDHVQQWMIENKNEEVDQFFQELFASNPTVRFKFHLRLWRYGVKTIREMIEVSKKYTLRGLVDRITCPMLVLDNELEYISAGQAMRLYEELKGPKAYHCFTEIEGAGGHCEPLASHRFAEVVYAWLGEILYQFRKESV